MYSMDKASWLQPRGEGKSLMQHLFDRLSGLYPKRWNEQFKDENQVVNALGAWADALVSRKINPEDVKRGLENCMEMFEYPPSLPQFLKACQTSGANEAFKGNEVALEYNPTPADKKKMAEEIEQIKESQPSNRVGQSKSSHHDWIFRIFEKYQKNPKSVSPSALRYAKQGAQNLGYEIPNGI